MLGTCPISPPGGWGLQKPPPGVRIDRKLAGFWALNEGGGARVNDATGVHAPGILNPANATWQPSNRGMCLRLDNSLSVQNRASLGDVDAHGDMTVACWIRPLRKTLNRDVAAVSKWTGSASSSEWILGLNYMVTGADYYPFFGVAIGTTIYRVAHTPQWNAGEWMFLAGVRRGASLYLYRGTPTAWLGQVGSAACGTGAINNVADRVVWLGEIPSPSYNTNADYLMVAMDDRAWTGSEIEQLHRQPFHLFESGMPMVVGQMARPRIDASLASDTPLVGAVA